MNEGRALENGREAYGARYVKEGFAWTPAMDLAFALGWPHFRTIVCGHPDAKLTGEERRKCVLAPREGIELPAELASARARANAAFMCGPDGAWRPEAIAAADDETTFTEDTARAFVAEVLARKHLSMGNQAEVIYALEAVVGPDVVLDAVSAAFEAMPTEMLRAHDAPRSGWARPMAMVKLRARPETVERAIGRMRSAHERAFAEPDQVFAASVAMGLDVVLFGHAATHVRKAWYADMICWEDAPPEVVRDHVRALEIDKWSFYAEPRLVFLGGDELLDVYVKKWPMLRDAEHQRDAVRLLGEIRSARVWPLMRELAEKSKAKKQAKAWLDAHPKPLPSAPVIDTLAPSTKPSIPLIDPAPILATFDAAFEGNDWPQFFELNPEDAFHGLRVIAARDGQRWGVLFERLEGCDSESMQVRRWRFGSEVPPGLDREEMIPFSIDDDDESDASPSIDGLVVRGRHGELALKSSMAKQHGLVGKASRFVTASRVYAEHFRDKGGVWPDVNDSVGRLGLGMSRVVVLATDDFEHHDGFENEKDKPRPSATETYRSLAAAVSSGDAARFVPGKPNTRVRDRYVAKPAKKAATKKPTKKGAKR